jgi:cobalamin synthase
MNDPSPHLSLRDLLNGISTDVQLLASQTLALGRLEVSAAVSTLAWSAMGLFASVFIAAAGAAVLVSALVLILVALAVPPWAAATLVGFVLVVGAALSARHFVNAIRQTEIGLRQTRQSIHETLEWLKRQTAT